MLRDRRSRRSHHLALREAAAARRSDRVAGVQEHRTAGQATHAETFARYAYVAGATEPRLVAAYATLLAAPGSIEALERAVNLCEAFLSRNGSTDGAWSEARSEARAATAWAQPDRRPALRGTRRWAATPSRPGGTDPNDPRGTRAHRFAVR